MKNLPKRIIHIEDKEDFKSKVKDSLASIPGLDIKQFNDLSSFIRVGHPDNEADLYILDRHFPDYKGILGDNLWNAISYISFLNPENKVLVLTHSPPAEREWRRYPCVREVFSKLNFNPDMFRMSVSNYLEIGGSQ